MSPSADNDPAEPPHLESNYDWIVMEDGERVERLHAAGWLDTAATEPRFAYITELMQGLFKVPICSVTLIGPNNVCLKAPLGLGDTVEVPRCYAMCNFVCVPPKPEVVVFENTRQDARLAHNPFVKGNPGLIFYAAAPLVGTGGTRYGTLCIYDYKPRSFTAEMYRMLINFAELVVQELEGDQALLERWTTDAIASARLNHKMQACISTATEGVAMMDTRRTAWELVYANAKFGAACGKAIDYLRGKGFWHMFQPIDGTKFTDITDTSAVAGSRIVRVESCTTGDEFSVALHPASTDRLAPCKATGMPSWVSSIHDSKSELRDTDDSIDVEKCFYFAVVVPTTRRKRLRSDSDGGHKESLKSSGAGSRPSRCSDKSALTQGSVSSYGDFTPPTALDGLHLGPLIGSGSFGKVYRGSWDGENVAVKVVRCLSEKVFQWSVNEGKLAMSVVHPNVVKTVQMGVDLAEYYYKEGVELDAVHILWIVQEFCNRGTLVDAVERGCMRTSRHIHSPPDMMVVYRTLKDIAEGMAAVHAQGIIHCDLNGRNVMLTASDADSRGFVAKVADFGLARVCHGEQISPCKLLGTVSHIPPELFTRQILSAAGDVWAFGVTMWEMTSGFRAYCGRNNCTIKQIVTSGKGALEPAQSTPQAFKDILASCMRDDPMARPTFPELCVSLERAIEEQSRA
eukprot:CAMPEP_0177784726 /NCGR_PEP_ID=MMETSP0491_2-20121128/19887_1 /TAXON_ID=63592 /ORGANISM="Tetraselmis chuii, Strain PLY429" /LENGTH=683 /DNA_ID=CAMNT_0019305577 /DNA_START=145 /DNA_END=2196 /DNA_ORIENTATION=-